MYKRQLLYWLCACRDKVGHTFEVESLWPSSRPGVIATSSGDGPACARPRRASTLYERAPEGVIHYTMRVRITKRLHGSIDGIQLERFRVGSAYEVGVSLACYLLAIRAAEPVPDNTPIYVLPPHRQLFGPDPRWRPRRRRSGGEPGSGR